jgi:HAMP domain-containing protein
MKLESSIRTKVILGFCVLAVILLFSSIAAIYEFTRMNNVTSSVIEDNIRSINATRNLLLVTEDYNLHLLSSIENDIVDKSVAPDFGSLKEDFNNIKGAAVYVDSIRYAYYTYAQVVREADEIWADGFERRLDWYMNRLQPFHNRLLGYIQNLTFETQNALSENSQALSESFYRSLMPSVAAVSVGLVVILLFNFFLNYYILNPILKISNGIKNYRRHKQDYIFVIDSEDEIQELNESIKDLIEDHKSSMRR